MFTRSTRFLAGRSGASVVQNGMLLTALQFLGTAIPLLVYPILARRMPIEDFGELILLQSIALWTSVLVEGGWYLTGPRRLAPVLGDLRQTRQITWEAQAAKVVMGLLMVLLFSPVLIWGLTLPTSTDLILVALAMGMVQGLHPSWIFLTINKLGFATLVDAACRFTYPILIFFLVQEGSDAVRPLLLQAITTLVSITALHLLLCVHLPIVRPFRTGMLGMVHETRTLLAFRVIASLYTQSSSMMVGVLSGLVQVAPWGAAEKILRTGMGLVASGVHAAYPNMTRVAANDRATAWNLQRRLLVLVVAITAPGAAILAGFAEPIVLFVFGSKLSPAVPVIQVLALAVPLIAASTVLGIHCLVASGRDKDFFCSILAGACAGLLLAFFLVPSHGALGMAWASVGAEAVVTGTMLGFWLQRTRVAPA